MAAAGVLVRPTSAALPAVPPIFIRALRRLIPNSLSFLSVMVEFGFYL
jgi:hypothetical protein